MGTTYSVKLVPSAGMPSLPEISQKIEAELESVNAQMSTYRQTSELSRFNSQTSTDWIDVSPDTARVVQLAGEISEISSGAFDVTIGPLVNLWGFGAEDRPESVPDEEQIEQRRRRVGFQKLQARLKPPALRKSQADLYVDLSAIAKGHGVDRIAQVLDALQITNYFIEVGGEIRTRGTRQDGLPWRVGIERPDEKTRGDAQAILLLVDQALATSGDYRNFYERDGTRYAHTIDPRTGYPCQLEIASASAVADSCALADAIATTMMVVGVEQGLQLAEKNSWAVLLIARQDDQLVSSSSSRFAELFPEVALQDALENAK